MTDPLAEALRDIHLRWNDISEGPEGWRPFGPWAAERLLAVLGITAEHLALARAWARVERALPEGWCGPSIAQNWLGRWYAYVYRHHEDAPANPEIVAHVSAEDHATPAAALDALSAKL